MRLLFVRLPSFVPRGHFHGALRAGPRCFSARPLLQPPAAEDETITLQDCGLDLDASGVHTLSVIGPSRRGKSVLAGLLAGGDPRLFPQSHSSFQAMTSGTHVVEVPNVMAGGAPLRIIDTEGLSHVGRSRSRREALVRQFLVSTYLSSSWLIWLDSEVLSTSFFTMMWLVHDYVVDVLKVRDRSPETLPKLMYIRTQETDVQRREYIDNFPDFGAFFQESLKTHEDADILRQMFAPGCLHGHSLPVWTVEDLDHFTAETFWSDKHASPFKEAVGSFRDVVLPVVDAAPQGEEEAEIGPPLLSLAELSTHLPRIASLEAFDPRDHEAAKVSRLRQHLRATYGKVVERAGGDNIQRRTSDLVNVFAPEDRDVKKNKGRIDAVVLQRLEEQCRIMRVNPDIAKQDKEVEEVLEKFAAAAEVFSAAADAFLTEELSERGIMMSSICKWRLDPDVAKAALAEQMVAAEARFQAATGLPAEEMRRLNMHEKMKWRIEDCVMRLRAKVAANMLLPRAADGGADAELSKTLVWRLGEWRGAEPGNGKTAPKPREYAVWTDGESWSLYQDRWDPKVSVWKGVLVDEGGVSGG
eukprot:CAMPEP_0195095284 /NCGR_PEP_ID=MMETSP0448-20130528/46756_1 /TAXON_ID=66468 /ORGANISM="Heterocapsa triquestra, Strain CCMP 448" /LENGTH=583 /DNA_ID=CAMNT_0040129471 /DNA_START=39 /DNA_END=1786 /DNA_ORIENTATION=-